MGHYPVVVIHAGRVQVVFDRADHLESLDVLVSDETGRSWQLVGQTSPIGGELITNGGFDQGLQGWRLRESPPGVDAGVDLTADWCISGSHTAFIRDQGVAGSDAILEYIGREHDGLIPVCPARAYHLSALAASHRCELRLLLDVYDSSRDLLKRLEFPVWAEAIGGRHESGYQRLVSRLRSEEGAAFLRLRACSRIR